MQEFLQKLKDLWNYDLYATYSHPYTENSDQGNHGGEMCNMLYKELITFWKNALWYWTHFIETTIKRPRGSSNQFFEKQYCNE